MSKTRVQLTDTGMDVIMKMSGGNPGAMRVLVEILKSDAVDPDSFLGGMGVILDLDTCQIYEDKIWMLYKDICNENVVSLIALMRGVQLGFMPASEITSALKQPRASLAEGRLTSIIAQVREALPAFAK